MTVEITVKGAVQGIGYRPFVAALAEQLHMRGNVRNSGGIVKIRVTDTRGRIDLFEDRLRREVPPGGLVVSVSEQILSDAAAPAAFAIVSSSNESSTELPAFPPDIGICSDCMQEMKNPEDRRYRYGLISCASCGPRWSILDCLPYDRDNTSMKMFPMCPSCAAEYRQGRRRHAQTISCHDCGPQMVFYPRSRMAGSGSDAVPASGRELSALSAYNRAGVTLDAASGATGEQGFQAAVSVLEHGGILALKGTGGYQLLCSPFRNDTVSRLRRMKGREAKPFAVMFPSVDAVRGYAEISEKEQALLESPARPIVLLERKELPVPAGKENVRPGHVEPAGYGANLPDFADQVAGESRYVGAFLPSVGIQQLILDETGPLIVTSANLSGEPIPVDDAAFMEQQFADGEEPDGIYTHNRPVRRPLDDSVMAVVNGHLQFIRRSRGYVPMPVFLQEPPGEKLSEQWRTVLAAGGDLKSAFAVGRGNRVILSQYLGDLADYSVMNNYRRLEGEMERIFLSQGREPDSPGTPDAVVCDLHPGYLSTRFAKAYAEERHIPCLQVQHHQAHAASVMAEHGLTSCIGVVFDGTGCGTDGQLWGGEFLHLHGAEFERLGSLSPVKLRGGDEVSVSADLSADCFRHWLGRDDLMSDPLNGMLLDRNFHTIMSTSTGRLFDAVSAMLGICHHNEYEGQCAVLLENAAWNALEQGGCCAEGNTGFTAEWNTGSTVAITAEKIYELWGGFDRYFSSLTGKSGDSGMLSEDPEDGRPVIDLRWIVSGVLRMQEEGRRREEAALAFHLALARAAAELTGQLADSTGERNICLSGGTFANRLMLTAVEKLLRAGGLHVFVNEQVPCNDGGIALGQAYLAMLAGNG